MKMKSISLGTERPDYSDSPISAPEEPKKTKMVYPSLYISDLKESIEMPDSGEATIKFKVIERRETERDGKTSCSYDLEVQDISFAAGKPGKTPSKSDDDEIESGLAEAEKPDGKDEAEE